MAARRAPSTFPAGTVPNDPCTAATNDDLGAIARWRSRDERGVDSASRASYCGFLLDHGQLIVGEQEDCVVAYAGSIPSGRGGC